MKDMIIQKPFYVKEKNVDNIVKRRAYDSNSSDLNFLFKVCFFDTKKHISECVLDIEGIENSVERINKSKLVVFDVKEINKNILINMLLNLTSLRKHYSPIVEVGESNVFFFPQLNYSDTYLLRTLFQQKYVGEKINIILGTDTIIE